METLLEVWDRHEIEMDELLEKLCLTEDQKYIIRIMQIKHQREELRAYQNDK